MTKPLRKVKKPVTLTCYKVISDLQKACHELMNEYVDDKFNIYKRAINWEIINVALMNANRFIKQQKRTLK